MTEMAHAARLQVNRATASVRVLCIGNGGVVRRHGRLWTQRCIGDFLGEMAGLAGEVCFCAWLDPNEDPLARTKIDDLSGVQGIALRRFDGTPFEKYINGVVSLARLSWEVWRADFAYLYWPGRIASVCAQLCRTLGKPYGIYFRGEEVDPDPKFAITFRRARFVITAGETLRKQAREYCSDVENVTPMTPVRLEHIREPAIRRDPPPWNLLYVGRIEERKGIRDLLAAACHLDEWGLPFTLTLVGHCPDPDAWPRGLPPSVVQRVRLVKAVTDFDQLIPYYRAADAFVLPSHDEGFPRVLYEAMALGVPILTTFVGSIPSLMEDQKNCVQLRVKDPKDIAEKVRLLFAGTELRERIATAGHHGIVHLVNTWKNSHSGQVAERLRALCPTA